MVLYSFLPINKTHSISQFWSTDIVLVYFFKFYIFSFAKTIYHLHLLTRHYSVQHYYIVMILEKVLFPLVFSCFLNISSDSNGFVNERS